MPRLHVALQTVESLIKRRAGRCDTRIATGDPKTLRVEPGLEGVGQDFGGAAVLGQIENPLATIKARGDLRMIATPASAVRFEERNPNQADAHAQGKSFQLQLHLRRPRTRRPALVFLAVAAKPSRRLSIRRELILIHAIGRIDLLMLERDMSELVVLSSRAPQQRSSLQTRSPTRTAARRQAPEACPTNARAAPWSAPAKCERQANRA